MIAPLLLSSLLSAGQMTGTMSPTSDLSQNRVKATGSTTARALKDRAADDVRVADFGVDVTGNCASSATNDAAIAAAITRAGATVNRKVLFPAGYICISDTIDDTAGLSEIAGQGSASTFISWKTGTSGTGKALLRMRGRTTHVKGLNLQGSPSGVPDAGVDVYPTIALIAQMHHFEDVWVGTSNPPAKGLISRDPPGGQQHEMFKLDQSRFSGTDVGIELQKPHEDLWTLKQCYIGHTNANGSSIRWLPGSSGIVFTMDQSWLIGPHVGMEIQAGATIDDTYWYGGGIEGPAIALDAGSSARVYVRGQGLAGKIRAGTNQTITLDSENAYFSASSVDPQFSFSASSSLRWKSTHDHFYIDSAQSFDPDTAFSFLVGGAAAGKSFEVTHYYYNTVPRPVKIGGATGEWFYSPNTLPMLQIQPLYTSSPSLVLKSSAGATLLSAQETGVTVSGNLSASGLITGTTFDAVFAQSDGSSLATLNITNLAWPSTDMRYTVGGNWGSPGGGNPVTYTANTTDTTDPIGLNGSMKWALTAGTNSYGIRMPSGTLSGNYNWSVFAKAGAYQYVSLDFSDALNDGATFDLSNCTTTYQTGAATVRVTDEGGGWCRCSLAQNLSSASYQPQVFVPQGSGGEVRNWAAAGTETVYLYGGQLTASSVTQVYIPTTTGTVTKRVRHLP